MFKVLKAEEEEENAEEASILDDDVAGKYTYGLTCIFPHRYSQLMIACVSTCRNLKKVILKKLLISDTVDYYMKESDEDQDGYLSYAEYKKNSHFFIIQWPWQLSLAYSLLISTTCPNDPRSDNLVFCWNFVWKAFSDRLVLTGVDVADHFYICPILPP